MFRLSREIRFAVNPDETANEMSAPVTNSFGEFPSLLGIGHYFSLDVCLMGNLDPQNGCMLNIKDIDQVVRQRAVPLATAFVRRGRFGGGGLLIDKLFTLLKDAWPGNAVHHLRLALSPTLSLKIFSSEYPMIRISQKFEFSASHRLHNPALSDDDNRKLFGKCNNPLGHGHNYVVQVTLAGHPDSTGVIIPVPSFEQIVTATVIDPFDHRNLNEEIPQFKDLIPSVENISMVIYRLLKPKFQTTTAKLAGVTVWETPKTWCEYME
jgi:6-pyruvoyltetrahydropterin/6-carboxytetrahydropterin synthase